MQSWFERAPRSPYCDNSILQSYLSPSVFTVRSGPVWRQDLAILSPEGPRDNTCQLCSFLFGQGDPQNSWKRMQEHAEKARAKKQGNPKRERKGPGVGWSRMSGRRASGTSRPSLGAQLLAVFSFVSQGKPQFQDCLGNRLEVPDILLPDIRGPPENAKAGRKTYFSPTGHPVCKSYCEFNSDRPESPRNSQ